MALGSGVALEHLPSQAACKAAACKLEMAQLFMFLRARCHYIKVRASSAGVTPQVLEDLEKETIRGLESKLQVNK